MSESYTGQDQIHGPNCKGVDIHHIGHSLYYTPNQNLRLNNILHVLSATKSLVSIHHLAKDNHAFLKYWSNFFSIRIKTGGKSFFKVDA
jgi:hypothetical protein